MENLNNKNIHFIGIGGAGMLPLALHCQKLGAKVTGSDASDENFALLRENKIFAVKGHGELSPNCDLVVYTSAVNESNVELKRAKEAGIQCYKRAELLGLLTKQSKSVLICGCHGKSTTSVILSDILANHEDFKATAIVGAQAASVNSNYYNGKTDWLVVEADEFDRSFLRMYPHDIIMLNIDDDHLDIYQNIEGIIAAFREFATKLSPEGVLIYNSDDEKVSLAIEGLELNKASFGLNRSAKYSIGKYKFDNFRTEAELLINGEVVGVVNYQYCGKHNLYNMLSTFALCSEKGVKVADFIKLITKFMGLKRRQELIYNQNYWLMDDYAHHPTEVKSSLEALRESFTGRIIALFQPHLYSRTKDQYREFAQAFKNADLVYISHIYAAREAHDDSINSSMIKEAMSSEDSQKTKVFENFESLYLSLKEEIKEGDLIVSLGAGEINKLVYRLKNELGE